MTIKIDKLIGEILHGGRRFKLTEDYVVDTGDVSITVNKGFVTDFASVPRFFWRIVPPWGKYTPAAVVHDWLYCKAPYTRKRADKIFLQIMRGLGVPRWKRKAMYRAVRLFGRSAWREHRKHDIKRG